MDQKIHHLAKAQKPIIEKQPEKMTKIPTYPLQLSNYIQRLSVIISNGFSFLPLLNTFTSQSSIFFIQGNKPPLSLSLYTRINWIYYIFKKFSRFLSRNMWNEWQGNVSNLKAKTAQFVSLKLQINKKKTTLTTPLNQAASFSPISAPVNVGRFRLDNLGPQPGSRKKAKRKGRGHAAGQGGSCGFGMRGQKSRSGPGVRRGFEGGQMPLYRRVPKLRGIAGGKTSWFIWWMFMGFYVLVI